MCNEFYTDNLKVGGDISSLSFAWFQVDLLFWPDCANSSMCSISEILSKNHCLALAINGALWGTVQRHFCYKPVGLLQYFNKFIPFLLLYRHFYCF